MTELKSPPRVVVECAPWQPACYRYLLHIALTPSVQAAHALPVLTVIQKNPSLADAIRSDPTAGKVEAWARRRGFAAVIYVNLFALRSPDPRTVNDVGAAEAIGAENDAAIVRACAAADVIVAAWGNPKAVVCDNLTALPIAFPPASIPFPPASIPFPGARKRVGPDSLRAPKKRRTHSVLRCAGVGKRLARRNGAP